MKTLKSLFVGVVVASSVAFGQGIAHASTFTWNFAPGPTSTTFGSTKTFKDTQNQYSITASGYKLTSETSPDPNKVTSWTPTFTTPNDLYGKYTGGDLKLEETGLGLTGSGDGEINKNSFIQLDLTALPNAKYVDLTISSLQSGETATIWGSNSAGTPGSFVTELTGGKSTAFQTYKYDLSKGSYLTVSADPKVKGSNDILIQSGLKVEIPQSVPESSSLIGILAVSTYGISSVLSRKLRQK